MMLRQRWRLPVLLACVLSMTFASEEPKMGEVLVTLVEEGEGPTGLIKAASGLCLNAHDRTNAGTGVHVWSCDSSRRNSLWDYDSESGSIQNHFGICVGAARRSTAGTQVTMEQCDSNSLDQQWDIDTSTKQIKNRHGLCIHASEETEGRVEMVACDTAASDQQWSLVGVSTDSGKGDPVDCKWTEWSQFS